MFHDDGYLSPAAGVIGDELHEVYTDCSIASRRGRIVIAIDPQRERETLRVLQTEPQSFDVAWLWERDIDDRPELRRPASDSGSPVFSSVRRVTKRLSACSTKLDMAVYLNCAKLLADPAPPAPDWPPAPPLPFLSAIAEGVLAR